MKITFHKYQATGNDFIMIDNRDDHFPGDQEDMIRHMCDRHFGIGADGLILLLNEPGYDFTMKYYNSDGKEGSMCGNGGRCAILFAHTLKMIQKSKVFFKAIDGDHEGRLDDHIRIKMSDVHDIKQRNEAYFMDTGSPHLVMLHHDLQNLDVVATGRAIRYDREYQPHGTNVNFIDPENDEIHIRTYERGVENETLSCGTGSVAAAISMAYQRQLDHGTFIIRSPGGRLSVSFEKDPEGSYKNIWLEGPASEVFSGQYTFNPSKSKLKYL